MAGNTDHGPVKYVAITYLPALAVVEINCNSKHSGGEHPDLHYCYLHTSKLQSSMTY
jgi:hypothetical protein